MASALRPLTMHQLQKLVAVSRREQPADIVIENATILNVYTRELMEGTIGISGKHIAYVGPTPPLQGDDTQVIDASGYVLVPGYIEPHAHPTQIYNPATMATQALKWGTVAVVNEGSSFFLSMTEQDFHQMLDEFAQYPIKIFWSIQIGRQVPPHLQEHFTPERLQRTLAHPFVVQVGEISAYPGLVKGDPGTLANILASQGQGKRVEGHLPGASFDTLNAASAAGVRACHESISVEEVLGRLRLGMYATLRLSSIRMDLPHLVEGLLKEGIHWSNRLMMTTDGATPPMWDNGFVDHLIKAAMEAGLDPFTAYAMATINPATYHGLDGEMGGIAPGRLADILFLRDLSQPRPVHVMAEGQMVVQDGQSQLEVALPEVVRIAGRQEPYSWRVDPSLFVLPATEQMAGQDQVSFPLIEMKNAVITDSSPVTLPVKEGQLQWQHLEPDILFATLINKQGTQVTNGLLRGYGQIEAYATSFSMGGGLMILGRNPELMAKAANRALEMSGGIVAMEGDTTLIEIPLSLYYSMSEEPFDLVLKRSKEMFAVLKERGYRFLDPLYSMIFINSPALPRVRITAQGILSVKDMAVLYPPLDEKYLQAGIRRLG